MQTASGLKFPTNSHCICWLYHALSKIWRDRNISQTKGLRNTGTVRTQSPLHTAWVPPHPLSSGTQDPGPLYLVLCYLCLGQPIAHQPNTGWFHFHPCSESEPCPSLNTKERGQKLYTSFSEQLKCQMEPPKNSLQHPSGEKAIPTMNQPRQGKAQGDGESRGPISCLWITWLDINLSVRNKSNITTVLACRKEPQFFTGWTILGRTWDLSRRKKY